MARNPDEFKIKKDQEFQMSSDKFNNAEEKMNLAAGGFNEKYGPIPAFEIVDKKEIPHEKYNES